MAVTGFINHKLSVIRNELAYRHSLWLRRRVYPLFAELGSGDARSGAILCEALWDHPHHYLRLAMMKIALGRVLGNEMVGLYEDVTAAPQVASLRAIGLTGEECVSSRLPSASARREAERLEPLLNTPRRLIEHPFPEGYPGAYFYDGVMKAERVGEWRTGGQGLVRHLASCLNYLEQYPRILERRDYRAVVVSHPTSLRFSTLVWSALKRRIPVYVLNYTHTHMTLRKLVEPDDLYRTGEPTAAERDALSPEQRRKLVALGKRELSMMRAGSKGEHTLVKVYGDGSPRFADRQSFAATTGSDPAKPNIVVMTNCWPDFPNSYGPTWYDDYVDWHRVTRDTVREIPGCNWFFKPHPAEHLYGDRTTLSKLLQDEGLPVNAFLWPEGATGSDVSAHADVVVSAAGSAGIEYPATGHRVLLARATPFTDWGFVPFARNRGEYAELLRRGPDLPAPSLRQQEDALLFFALMSADAEEGGYVDFPYGLLSYRLWSSLPKFVASRREAIAREIDLMERWLRWGSHSYHVFKIVRPDLDSVKELSP